MNQPHSKLERNFGLAITAVLLLGCLAALLVLLIFFASTIPVIGVGLVWISAAIMIVWDIIAGNVDNVIKPWLINQGSDMPFILIFFGVFLGPTLVAVGFRLVEGWTPKPLTNKLQNSL